jgi:uncharacterized protein
MGRVVHFELFSSEPGALVDFYRTVFGWDISSWEGPFEYHLVGTGSDKEMGINGAIAPLGSAGSQPVAITVGIDDIDAAAAAILAAGGTAVTEKNVVEGVGWQQYFKDPSGAVFGVLQPDMTTMAGAGASTATSDQWNEVGDRLRDIGVTIGQVVQDAADSPQGKQLKEQAEKAATAIGEASRTAADKARPHVITALDRVATELGDLAARLRSNRDDAAAAADEPAAAEPSAEAPEGDSGESTPEA